MRKVYEGETLPQALLKMQIDLGKDAIIVEHKKIKKGGVFGFFGNYVYQVVAIKPKINVNKSKNINTYDNDKEKILDILKKKNKDKTNNKSYTQKYEQGKQENKSTQKSEKNVNETFGNQKNSKVNFVIDEKIIPEFSDSSKKNTNQFNNSFKNVYTKNKNKFSVKKNENIQGKQFDYNNKLNTEIDSLKSEIKNLSKNMELMFEKNVKKEKISYPGKLSEVYIRLIENEVEPEFADEIINKVKQDLKNENEVNNIELVEKIAEKHIIELLKIDENPETQNQRKIVVLIGPTGVGKTTTIAKLGAIYSLLENKPTGFLTIDTFRLAAVEQLQKYAEILETPLEIIFKPEDFNEKINKFSDKQVILVDTAGISPKNEEHIYELKRFVDNTNEQLEVFLVIQATTKYSDMHEIIQEFKDIGYAKILITKIDETLTFGPIFNLLHRMKIPVEYVTTGQEVPDDIEKFDPYKFSKALLNIRE